SGPLRDMDFSVQEGGGPRILHQFTLEPPAVSFRVSGEKAGIIDIEPKSGILYINGSLDWETKQVHNLQVESLDESGKVVKGPYAVKINVEDINDNPPEFDQTRYSGVVRQNSRPGKPFMYVHATDRDDPTTPHAQLSYSILHHFPNPYDEMLFQIDSATGAISPSRTGSYYLDPQKQDTFTLVVSVKDMAGMTTNAFTSSVDVIITVRQSLWKAPPTIHIRENSTEAHPVNISKVQSNEPDVIYGIFEKEKLPRLPFSISTNGDIYVTEPLDREEKDSYTFFVVSKDNKGELVDKPLQIHVVVEDINDNPPVCQQALTVIEVQENEIGGKKRASVNLYTSLHHIGTVFATDMDKEDSLNSRLRFKIQSQEPEFPAKNLFYIQQDTGNLHLTGRSLSKRDSAKYSLKVLVSDPAFQTICDVEVHVIDINDQIPIFEKSDYNSVTVPENIPIGTVILEIQATDGDEPATGSSLIVYQVKEGDPNNTFIIETDSETNQGFVKINKALDFETMPEYNLVINATNPEPLVPGVQYNSSSLTAFKVFVTNVDEPPVFLKPVYRIEVSEGVPVNTLVMTVEAYDPEGDSVRVSKIVLKEVQGKYAQYLARGKILFLQKSYLLVEGGSQKSKVFLILHLRDVNDNHPQLATDYPAFFCYPVSGGEKTLIQAIDADEQFFYSKFTFSLADEMNTRNNWEISTFNATHAYLSPKHANFEEKEYNVPIILNDNGKPPLENKVNLKVSICKCSSENSCF
ncbi:CAD17 protein, partial [Ifrita kowaldi]|nr:CAD17 protein [Ifrita kowaldi]